MIVIVDYGMGNLRSVQKALEKLGFESEVSAEAREIAAAQKLIVPGVGAFGDAMAALGEAGLVGPIRDYAASGRPVLGICLGMQLFFESSEEAPGVEGLGLLAGTVKRFQLTGLKVPHMGWNTVSARNGSRLLDSSATPHMYFVHSFYVAPQDDAVGTGVTEYGHPFVSMVEKGSIQGVQFHPEKSQAAGLNLLKRFASA